MPSRKSDVRRSDVSAVARPADDEDSPMTTTGATQEPAANSAAPVVAPTEQSSSETPQLGESSAAGVTAEKGKDKEKDRERERREDAITIEDLNLPKSIITRLAKGVLPPNTQIQANAILALSKSATVFISHLSNAANEWTMSAGKKTIMPADVFRALDDIEYGFMREKLEAEFAKFNETQSTKRSAYRKKVSAAKRAAKGLGCGDGSSVADSSVLSTGTGGGAAADESAMADATMGGLSADGDRGRDRDGGRAAKKAKVDDGAAGDGKMMDVDGEREREEEVSDAETQPDEHVDEDEDDDQEEEEEEEEEDEDEDEDEDEERERGNGEVDELEERTGRDVEDEALDEDSE